MLILCSSGTSTSVNSSLFILVTVRFGYKVIVSFSLSLKFSMSIAVTVCKLDSEHCAAKDCFDTGWFVCFILHKGVGFWVGCLS